MLACACSSSAWPGWAAGCLSVNCRLLERCLGEVREGVEVGEAWLGSRKWVGGCGVKGAGVAPPPSLAKAASGM